MFTEIQKVSNVRFLLVIFMNWSNIKLCVYVNMSSYRCMYVDKGTKKLL